MEVEVSRGNQIESKHIIKAIIKRTKPDTNHLSLRVIFSASLPVSAISVSNLLLTDNQRFLRPMTNSSNKDGTAIILIRNKRETILRSVKATISTKKRSANEDEINRDL